MTISQRLEITSRTKKSWIKPNRRSTRAAAQGTIIPTHLPSLLHSLKSRGLRITSTWFGTAFTTGVNFEAAITGFKQQIEFLKAVNAKDVVVAELANAVNQVR